MISNEHEPLQPSPIETLSVELVRMILSALPDIATLQKTAISCPLFYHAFLEVEKFISTRIISSQVDHEVLPEAFAAIESSKARKIHSGTKHSDNKEAVTVYIARNLRQRPEPPKLWTLNEAVRLEKLHISVSWFANKFATEALAKDPLNRTNAIATPQEISRIQRALYRFEIYCNLFRDINKKQSIFYPDQKTLFFSNFAPWEIEQLGSVHDFLARAVTPAFADIAEHDVAWGAFRVDYNPTMDSPYIQHLLSLGLNRLHQIAQSETYEERHKALYKGVHPGFTCFFLYEGLQAANERNDNVWLDELTSDDEPLQMKTPYYADPDCGPRDVWRWAHHEESWGSWVYQKERNSLRQWGYIMWNKSRLERTGIFQKPWEEEEIDPEEELLKEQEATRQEGYMMSSWDQREKVFRRGGDGWWRLGDESKLKWENGVAPRRGAANRPEFTSRIQPKSLQDAREMLSKLKLPSSVK